MKLLTIDIETQALAPATLAEIKPVFEPAKNLKDPAKIAESVAGKEAEWLESATLDAARSVVLAVGLRMDGKNSLLYEPKTEYDILKWTWEFVSENGDAMLVGHNILDFDIPFLIRRSLKHGLKIPRIIRYMTKWQHDSVFDTLQEWQKWTQDRVSLDKLAWHLGVGRKTGDGAMFWKVFQEDRAKALAYLENDLMLAEQCAIRMMACTQ